MPVNTQAGMKQKSLKLLFDFKNTANSGHTRSEDGARRRNLRYELKVTGAIALRKPLSGLAKACEK